MNESQSETDKGLLVGDVSFYGLVATPPVQLVVRETHLVVTAPYSPKIAPIDLQHSRETLLSRRYSSPSKSLHYVQDGISVLSEPDLLLGSPGNCVAEGN